MNKLIATILIGSVLVATDYGYNGSSSAVVALVGGTIKTKNTDDSVRKYKRKNCPVCKGQGWYWSGDKIKKVECGYCEPDNKDQGESEVTHPPVVIKPDCKTRVRQK